MLFGDLLTANAADLLRTFIAFSTFICLIIFTYNKIVHIGLDPEGAVAYGIKVDYLFDTAFKC